jgi:hypothetical protein
MDWIWARYSLGLEGAVGPRWIINENFTLINRGAFTDGEPRHVTPKSLNRPILDQQVRSVRRTDSPPFHSLSLRLISPSRCGRGDGAAALGLSNRTGCFEMRIISRTTQYWSIRSAKTAGPIRVQVLGELKNHTGNRWAANTLHFTLSICYSSKD